MEESERRQQRRRGGGLDWDKLLAAADADDDAGRPPPVLIVTRSSSSSSSGCSFGGPLPVMESDDWIAGLSDQKLAESIASKARTLRDVQRRLHDGGDKLRSMLRRLEEEQERRKLRRVEKDADESEEPTQSTSAIAHGASDGLREVTTQLTAPLQSSFAKIFSEKLEDKTPCRASNLHKNEPPSMTCSNPLIKKSIGKISPRKRKSAYTSSRKQPFKGPRNLSVERADHLPNGDRKTRSSSIYTLRGHDGMFSSRYSRRENDFHGQLFKDLKTKKEPTVVLVDEEECQQVERTEGVDRVNECMKDATIYYPSRYDPQSVEICYADIECLAPEHYLTSPIMNFYILYLQQQALESDKGIHDYHFFNTYFYKKLQEALSCEGKEKDALFVKFRRWWKGVNIFQKAYVFIPIHEDLHWSLAIICIPDEDCHSGPIILHLDSLRLHRSRSIFDYIRSFLVEEWSYLRQQVAPSDLLIEEEIWEVLPDRIGDKIIAVPQQKNDYDCGLFVLHFMERFTEEAPDRLKKKDLAMFGKQWFKPEEASGLRVKIQNLLVKEFQDSTEGQHASGSSDSDEAPAVAECVDIKDP
ncbi:ubiquitin-like-specific protease 1D isoform X2 [Syzygium oleosum]|uniref:ubiquitin-like-specific protease 1D isoform X2 n=1 Tax=Syzygium oleosum TaxID=219896 RepID=UPI0024B9C7FC|nr:ubiquitin-like-specific protease 1D isoform X2 [Syzygium oleosum]